MTTQTLEQVIKILRKEIKKWKTPAVGLIAVEAENRPFETLISCVISLRTKDAVTEAASKRLFARASTPGNILELSQTAIENLIYPAGFYRTKARNILQISRIIVDKYGGRVPRKMEELLELPGVGRKTANLVLTVGYGDYGICVDTHVHRITNLLGYVKTRHPEETEFALRKKLPKRYWKTYNDLLVTFGQNLCVPVSPWCSKCHVEKWCEKRGLKKHR